MPVENFIRILPAIQMLLFDEGQEVVYNIFADHLNTPRLITNQAGQAVWRWDNNDAFGANAPNENPSGLGAFEFPLRLSNYYHDKETGTDYAMLRDCYDSTIGRFCQSDPIGLAGGINTYAYVGSNPLSFIDPKGLVRTLPGPGGVPIPVPTPLPSPGGKKPGSANDDLFDPPMPQTPQGIPTTQSSDPLPPPRPGGPNKFCEAILERCLRFSLVCGIAETTVRASCYVAYGICIAISRGRYDDY